MMFTNRATNGRNNIAGLKIKQLRKNMKVSQRIIAEQLQKLGLKIDKNAIQRIEHGERFVTDIELMYLAKLFSVSVEYFYCNG